MNDLDALLGQYGKLHDALCGYDQEEAFMKEIHEAIQDSIDALPLGTRIGFRPCCDQTNWLIDHFDFGNASIAGIFDKSAVHNDYQGIPVYEADGGEAQNVDVFIVASFNWRREIARELEKDGRRFLDLHEILERKGKRLHASPDNYRKGTHNILHYYWQKWKGAKEGEKEGALRSLMTAACEAKDFLALKGLCEEWKAEYPFAAEVERECDELHDLLREAAKKRTGKKDVTLYWLDAVPYKWKGYFENLDALSGRGICFEQAYACTPYTHQTLRAMFSGILPLDDWERSLEEVGPENSDLVRYLEGRGYEVFHVGHDAAKTDPHSMQDKFLIHMDKAASCNAVLWEAFCRAAASDKPVFSVAHFVVETHSPMICAELDELNYAANGDDCLNQFKVSSAYIDKRVMYYYDIARNGDGIQIVLSDHGEHVTRSPERFWTQNKLHACCAVLGGRIEKKREKRLFSYVKFKELVKWLVEPGKYGYDECFSEWAPFQDTDIYSETLANTFIKRGAAEYALAYRGALDGTYKYAVNGIGREFFYRIVDDEDVEITEGEAVEAYVRLKARAGAHFPDLSAHEKYRHVKRLHEAAGRSKGNSGRCEPKKRRVMERHGQKGT